MKKNKAQGVKALRSPPKHTAILSPINHTAILKPIEIK
jgi:hypothetical protein